MCSQHRGSAHPDHLDQHSLYRHSIRTMSFIPNGVKYLKRHSFANISEAWRGEQRAIVTGGRPLRPHSPGRAGLPAKNAHFESLSTAIVHVFQKKRLPENELSALQENIRHLMDTDAGPLIYDYYKDKLMKKGMVILRESIKHETGSRLLTNIGEQWSYFYQEILPVLQMLLYPVMTKNLSIRQVALLEFRNIVLLKLPVSDALHTLPETEAIPPVVQQMLLVLQNVHEIPCTDKSMQLEALVAQVVRPYLGLRGVYDGQSEPQIRSNFIPPPKVMVDNFPNPMADVTVSSEDLYSADWKSRRHRLAPLAAQRQALRHSGMLSNQFLTTVKEQDFSRRHSIDAT